MSNSEKLDLTAHHSTFQIYCLYVNVAYFHVLKELSIISITLSWYFGVFEKLNSVYPRVCVIFMVL